MPSIDSLSSFVKKHGRIIKRFTFNGKALLPELEKAHERNGFLADDSPLSTEDAALLLALFGKKSEAIRFASRISESEKEIARITGLPPSIVAKYMRPKSITGDKKKRVSIRTLKRLIEHDPFAEKEMLELLK
jgi:hypothetical protein